MTLSKSGWTWFVQGKFIFLSGVLLKLSLGRGNRPI